MTREDDVKTFIEHMFYLRMSGDPSTVYQAFLLGLLSWVSCASHHLQTLTCLESLSELHGIII